MGKIIAIGGGQIGQPKKDGSGNYPVETTAIDRRILQLTNKKNPKLLFLPTASYDSTEYYEAIKKQFTRVGFDAVDALYLSDKTFTKEQIKNTILSYDAIYVGGGNTLRMMVIWRRHGVDEVLKQAFEKGIVLAGISAGSICWFRWGSSDSRKFTSKSDKLIKVTGLGLIDALHCPHYDTEPFRQEDLKRRMKNIPKIAIALDDCAALEVVDEKYRVITTKPTARARKAYWQHGKYIIQEIAPQNTHEDLHTLLRVPD